MADGDQCRRCGIESVIDDALGLIEAPAVRSTAAMITPLAITATLSQTPVLIGADEEEDQQ